MHTSDTNESTPPAITCPKHKTSLQETPICLQCNFPLECPNHMMHVNLQGMCNTYGRRQNEPAPEKPHPFPNRCHAHMLEWNENGKCRNCGRDPGDAVGPPWAGYKAMLERWEQAVAAAEKYLATQAQKD